MAVALIVAALPLYLSLAAAAPAPALDMAQAQQGLENLRQAITQAQQENACPPNRCEILFIRERQLLTFGALSHDNQPRLVDDYELVFLTEMEMSNNSLYLERFYTDLRQHRFALIVSDPLYTGRQGSLREFGEENDAWAERVAEPLLCAYQPAFEIPNNAVVLLPRTGAPPPGCPSQ